MIDTAVEFCGMVENESDNICVDEIISNELNHLNETLDNRLNGIISNLIF